MEPPVLPRAVRLFAFRLPIMDVVFSGDDAMVNLNDLNMSEVRDHYLMREQLHGRLRELFEAGNVREYTRLALGMTDPAGNYSASEHVIGPRILAATGAEQD